jgi:hypothetical protein
MPRGATLVVVTAVVTPDLVAVLSSIRRAGHPVTLVETTVANSRGVPIHRGISQDGMSDLGITYHSVHAEGNPIEIEQLSL